MEAHSQVDQQSESTADCVLIEKDGPASRQLSSETWTCHDPMLTAVKAATFWYPSPLHYLGLPE